jgi:hypothetical protein
LVAGEHHGAGEEARGAEGGVPVGGGKVGDRTGVGDDVRGDGRDPEEDAAGEQADPNTSGAETSRSS